MSVRWAAPAPGDIAWCIFPELPNLEPGPKPRPALVVHVERREDGVMVRVVYGTSKRLSQLKTGEFAITQSKHPAAHALAGLASDTKFDFKTTVDLPWSERYFKVPPTIRHGNSPKIGTLHATVLRAVEAAHRAAASR